MSMDLSEEESTPLVIRDRGGSQRSSSSSASMLQVHLYFFPGTKDATTIHISSGQISAENVCIQAGKKCGILPIYQSLFGLASADLSFWYAPSHMFDPDENLQVHFRVRFFFGNWFEQGPRTSYRYSLTRDRVNTVLDYSVIDYLFAQLRSDFIASEAGVAPPLSTQEECLGLAVLDLWRMAKERHQSVREVCRTVSYKSCLPKSHRHDIQRRNRLDRYRIRNTLKHFLRKLGNCSVDECSLKLKYLIELAGIEPSLGSEIFQVNHASSHSMSTFSLVRVTGETGIQTSGSCHSVDAPEWHTFCDFQEIIDIGIRRVCHEQVLQDSRMVTITRKDDKCFEAKFQTLKEALSFVSLVDGYFRLTTDSSHFFCQDIAPPSILEGIKNHCHGPITSEFAVNKLKKSGYKGGTFLLRQSPKYYDNFFLTVCVQTPLGLDYKDCLIIKNENYSLPGVHKSFSSLRELTSYYQHNKLLLAEVPVKLARCCPPRPKELTNLIIIRSSSSVEAQGSPTPERNKFSHIQFHMIKYNDLKWDESLGQGSFTRIFKGYKIDIRDGEKHMTEVLLKELDAVHKNCWESLFEAASLMSQISHKHLLLVYGVSVHGVKNIMVQEFVKHGALDLYLKRGRSVSVSWKLDVAKQLASALNFLEEKNIVHGNICAKNLLLAREGDPSQGTSPFIKLSDPGISVAMLGKDVVLDRIPWVAPELLEAPDDLTLECDKWSFGATVWEIFNNGNSPLRGWNLPHGSLIGYLENNRHNVNTRRMLLFASQICKGMEYLQTLRYVHRDLAARNILVASESLVKIADFGLTKVIPCNKEYYRVTQPGESPIFWYAPESISESRFSHKSDVWSFGVVLHELFSYCDVKLSSLYHQVYSLMKQCWAYSFDERPCFSSSMKKPIQGVCIEKNQYLVQRPAAA